MTTLILRIPTLAWRVLVVLLACWAMFSSNALAQTTGAIEGCVSDEDGFEVPGANVSIQARELIGGQQTVSTNEKGCYRFQNLPPGAYKVIVNMPGFNISTSSGIEVLIRRTARVNVVLQVGDEETVEVRANQTVDTESTSVGEVLTKNYLQNLPVGRSYQSALGAAAGVTGGANPNMAGGASNENTYLVDGNTITDPVTGTFGANFNYDAIQQIEILLGGYEPEYGESLGGLVNIVTESGSNNLQFDTSVFLTNGNWRPRMDERLTADGFRLGPTGFDDSFSSLQVAGKVSGPIVKDKAWFVLSYQHTRSLIALAGVPQRRDFDGHYILAKFTMQPSSEHRITLFFQANPTTIDNIRQGSPFIKKEAQGRQAQSGFNSSARWQWFLNDKVNLDTRLNVNKIGLEQYTVPCTHDLNTDRRSCRPWEDEGTIDFSTPARFGQGGAFNSGSFGLQYFDDRWRIEQQLKLQVLNVVDPLGGTHDFKVGVIAEQLINEVSIAYNGNSQYIDTNLAAFDPDTLTGLAWIETSGGFQQRQTSALFHVFAQDFYKPVSNVTVKYGLRFDRSLYRNDIGDAALTGNLWGPRFHVVWDPFNDQLSKVAAGYGRYNDSGRGGLADFTNVGQFGSKAWFGEINYQDGGLGTVASQSEMLQYDPRRNLNSVNDRLLLPSLDEFIFLAQRQLVPDVSLGTNFQARFIRHGLEPDERNYIFDEDGSAVIGTRFDDPLNNYYRLRTPRRARRNYYRVDVFLEKVESKRWAARLTYSYTFTNGSSPNALSGSFVNNPQTQFNYGQLLTAVNHSVKGIGYWTLPTDPYAITLGAFFNYESGRPLERLYRSDVGAASGGGGSSALRIRPRGIYWFFNDIWSVGVSYRQFIDIKRGQLVIEAQLENMVNNLAPANFLGSFYTQNRLFTAFRQDPLRIQLGLRYQF